MHKPAKVLLCQRSTGIVLNPDTATLFVGDNSPYAFFESLAEAEDFANQLLSRIADAEVVVYEKEVAVKTLYNS